MSASCIDGLISLFCGIYVSLVGFGVVVPGKDRVKSDAWLRKWGGFMKIAGPLIALSGLFHILKCI